MVITGGVICTVSYVQDAIDAERRMRRGERQLYCETCRLWQWPDGCTHEGRLTAAEFRSLCRAVAKVYPVRRVQR